ncbi:hypothetical protein [Geodermatophilus obscurus]|uniref:Uncharacterized protein n=1 Tax=Geodermatophilus obscurus (strain ATCC 25078 / DSM 43160 / JCM 3152 / CCUG 61914 / KCC A-0152 / KCTC 9177 / NBRC 13315 / NRRL B-3577 / G-20) TaxID=526225 RepID=D2S8T5_GEOOG|nr:hypothetical protein [Geodermatophilus obscurus]ADB75666.1 hypothetical protein Gobs_3056 [Geodermatophilus obscurus DSM 43160]
MATASELSRCIHPVRVGLPQRQVRISRAVVQVGGQETGPPHRRAGAVGVDEQVGAVAAAVGEAGGDVTVGVHLVVRELLAEGQGLAEAVSKQPPYRDPANAGFAARLIGPGPLADPHTVAGHAIEATEERLSRRTRPGTVPAPGADPDVPTTP